MLLYHATSVADAWSIYNSGRFIPSQSGLDGPGVYFSKTKSAAINKSGAVRFKHCDTVGVLYVSVPDHFVTNVNAFDNWKVGPEDVGQIEIRGVPDTETVASYQGGGAGRGGIGVIKGNNKRRGR